MNNYIQPGKVLTLTAPYARDSGQAAMVGSIFGVATNDVDNAVDGEFQVEGVFELAKTSAQAWTQGDQLYWNASTKAVSNDSTVGPLVGTAVEAAANPSSTGTVRLNGSTALFAEGQEAVITALTDNGGGAAADNTIGAVTAPSAITDNSGGVDPGNNTIAVVTNPDLSAWNGSTDPSSAQATAIGAAFTAAKAAVAQLAAKQNVDRTAIVALTDAIKELSTKQNEVIASLKSAGIIASA
jgi:predicted RecA/RadA family phage recombinase